MGRKDLKIRFDAATTQAGTSAAENYREYVPLKSFIKLPPSPIQTLEDIRQWIHQNETVNQEYRTLVLPLYQKQLQSEKKYQDIQVTKLEQKNGAVI